MGASALSCSDFAFRAAICVSHGDSTVGHTHSPYYVPQWLAYGCVLPIVLHSLFPLKRKMAAASVCINILAVAFTVHFTGLISIDRSRCTVLTGSKSPQICFFPAAGIVHQSRSLLPDLYPSIVLFALMHGVCSAALATVHENNRTTYAALVCNYFHSQETARARLEALQAQTYGWCCCETHC